MTFSGKLAARLLGTFMALSLVQSCLADPREDAVQAARAGRHDEAIDALRNLSVQSDDIRIRYDLIAILGWAGRHREALSVWLDLKGTPLPDYVKPELVLALLETGQIEAAEVFARDWLRSQPDSIAALVAAGWIAERRGQRFDALRFYGRAEALDPERRDLHETMARLLSALGGSHGAVGQALQPAQRQRADRAATRLRWAMNITTRRHAQRFVRVDQVLAELDDLIGETDRQPATEPALRRQLLGDRAVARVARERWQEALHDVRTLREMGGELPAYVRLAEGGAWMGLRRPESALEAYDAVIATDPDSLEARYGRFYALVELSDWRAAYRTIDAIAPDPVRRVGPEAPPQADPDWLFARITAARVRGWAEEHEPAWTQLKALSDKAPANPALRAALASVAAARGWPRLAEEEARIAESLDEEDRDVQIELAESALRRGQWPEFRRRLAALRERHPTDQSVLRMQRESALSQGYEFRLEINQRNEGGQARGAPGDALSLSTRLYGPPLDDQWRIFTAAERLSASAPGVFSAVRQRLGIGSQYRHADMQIEASLWQNSGAIDRDAFSIDARQALDDHWSISGSYSSFSSDTPLRAVGQGITASAAALGAGYTLSERTAISGQWRQLDFSDGNLRRTAQLTLSHRVYTAPDFNLSIRPSLASSSNSRTDGPYFSPERDLAASLALAAERTLWRRYERSLSDRLVLSMGRYRQAGFASGRIADAAYEQTLRLQPAVEVSYGLGWNRRIYDGVPESALLTYLQLTTRF